MNTEEYEQWGMGQYCRNVLGFGNDFRPGNPNGAQLRYLPDTLGRLQKVQAKASASGALYETEYVYDASGNVNFMNLSLNGHSYQISFGYDAAHRMLARTNTSNGATDGVETYYRYTYQDGQSTVDPDNMVREIEHKNRAENTLVKVTWKRAGNGEPEKITREDGSYVLLGYQSVTDVGHHLLSETFKSPSTPTDITRQTLGYTFNAEGNRATRVIDGSTASYSYGAGSQLLTVSGTPGESYAYDNGGAITTVNQNNVSRTLTFDSVDRLTGVSGVIGYTYDPLSQRKTALPQNGAIRQYVTGPTMGLPSPHLILDGSGSVVQGYVYGPDGRPVLRFDAAGNVTYYLEDPMGSVIGLAGSNPTPGNLTKFFYDGFGNFRPSYGAEPATILSTTGVPAGTGGDYRFQGQWLDAETGFYHMTAREYDPGTGRFLTRDPEEGSPKAPESYAPYQFANGNPYLYSDPSGEFTIIEINVANSLQSTLHGVRAMAIQKVKQRLTDSLLDSVTDYLWKQIPTFVPGFNLQGFDKFINGNFGNTFQNLAQVAICKGFNAADMGDNYHFGVRVSNSGRSSGDPSTAGENCNGDNTPLDERYRGNFPSARSYSIPDFIISSEPPLGPRGGIRTGYLVGEYKAAASTFYNSYVAGGNREQFTAIVDYARKHTYSHTAVFVVGLNNIGAHKGSNRSKKWDDIRALLGKQMTRKGVIGLMITVLD